MFARRNYIISALPRLLGPIAGLCIRNSIKLDEILEAMKRALLDAAASESLKSGVETSSSRYSIMTGVHRKDVARLRDTDAEPPVSKNLTIKVIGQWENDRRFVQRGKPKQLVVEGKESEFVELVQSVSVDLNPYAVLFELERIGAVAKNGDKVELVRQVHSSRGDFSAGVAQLARDLGDFVSCVEENLSATSEKPNHHLSTEFDNLAPDKAEAIQELLLREGQRVHKRVRSLISKFDRDINRSVSQTPGRLRAVFGSFGRVEEVNLTK